MTKLTTVATTGRRMKRSVNFVTSSLHVGRVRIILVAGLNGIVHLHRHAAAEFKYTGADYFGALLEPGKNRDLIAAGCAEFHKLLLDLLVFHDEDGVAVRRIADGRGRYGNDCRFRQEHLDVHEHAWAQFAFRVL